MDLDFTDFPDFSEKGPTACATYDPDMWFPEPDGQNFTHIMRRAKEICFTCPYQLECLRLGVEKDEPGVWGGASQPERRQMKRKNKIEIPLSGPIYNGHASEKRK
jgi:hypothetical protein